MDVDNAPDPRTALAALRTVRFNCEEENRNVVLTKLPAIWQ